MQIKKILCLLLCLTMLVSMLAGCGNQETPDPGSSTPPVSDNPPEDSTPPEETDTPSVDHEAIVAALNVDESIKPELVRASQAGFPMSLAEQATISGSELVELLDIFIESEAPDKLSEWKEIYPTLRSDTQPLTRFNAMAAIFLATRLAGEGYANVDASAAGSLAIDWNKDYLKWELYGGFDALPMFDVGQGESYLDGAAYAYFLGRVSSVSYEYPFAIDEESNSLRVEDNCTYAEALLAIVRLMDSLLDLPPRTMTDADKEILENADLRRESIINSETSVTVTGNQYYVSNDGDDENDGLSEETPWRTLQKVNSMSLSPGDGVFFRRGDIWRGEPLIGQTGVAYSAYGTGAKPAIYGSPENGAGAEKWSLLDGTDNIWIFYRDIGDCGDLVIDGSMELADRAPVWWTGEHYVSYQAPGKHDALMEKDPFEPANELNNLEYHVDIDYSDLGTEYPIYVYFENQRTGKLYLRCDEGNPGEIYSSIEFCCDLYQGCVVSLTDASDCTVDNLGIFYGGHALENCHGGLIQNCEVGFMGAMNHTFYYEEPIYSGDGIIHGNQMTVQNNYIHHTYNGGIAAGELSFAADESYANQEEIQGGNLVQGNLLEYTSGITLINWETEVNELHMFRNIVIRDNYVLYSECSGAADNKVAHGVVGSLVFTGSDQPTPNANENILIEQNVFYCSENALIISGMPENYYPTYSGNIYAQYPGYPFAYWLFRDGNFKTVFSRDSDALTQFVHDEIGDQTGVVLGE